MFTTLKLYVTFSSRWRICSLACERMESDSRLELYGWHMNIYEEPTDYLV
jgi:hypothetical protein